MEQAQVALNKAQTTAVYAGLNLWPAAVMGDLVRSQRLEEGTCRGTTDPTWSQGQIADFDPNQPRDPDGQWTAGSSSLSAASQAVGEGANAGTGQTNTPKSHIAMSALVRSGEPPSPKAKPFMRQMGRKSSLPACTEKGGPAWWPHGLALQPDVPDG